MVANSVSTISDLKNLSGRFAAGDAVVVDGYYNRGDGGGGLFYFEPSVAGTVIQENGGTVIYSSKPLPGTWRRLYSGGLNVRWFGARGDGKNDDFVPFQNALSVITQLPFSSPSNPVGNQLLIPFGVYILSRTLEISRHMILQGESGGGRYSGSQLQYQDGTDGNLDSAPS